jgi:glucosylceramidase
LRGAGVVSASTRDATMQKLFDPVNGIGLSFTRNPMGASDLARFSYSYDDTCCDLNDVAPAATPTSSRSPSRPSSSARASR